MLGGTGLELSAGCAGRRADCSPAAIGLWCSQGHLSMPAGDGAAGWTGCAKPALQPSRGHMPGRRCCCERPARQGSRWCPWCQIRLGPRRQSLCLYYAKAQWISGMDQWRGSVVSAHSGASGMALVHPPAHAEPELGHPIVCMALHLCSPTSSYRSGLASVCLCRQPCEAAHSKAVRWLVSDCARQPHQR